MIQNWKKQGVKMYKIVSAVGGYLYISLKCDGAALENEFSTKTILHFMCKKHIITLSKTIFPQEG